ncbi:hypothetical protein [Glutamicibacter arilaitensis]|uniref:hypothetical protein n=1 Tax=Glutamicibacter arilaitensis TaxID=256701 RepID=UPI00384DA558
MSVDADCLIIGRGAMGSAVSHALAARGAGVLKLELYAPGRQHGASHGATRNFNPAYATTAYVRCGNARTFYGPKSPKPVALNCYTAPDW